MNTYNLKKLMLCLVLFGMMSPLMNAQDTPEEPSPPEPPKKKISIDINFNDDDEEESADEEGHDHDGHDHDGHDHDGHDHDGHDHDHDVDEDDYKSNKVDAFTSSFDIGMNYFMQDGNFDLSPELNDLEIDNWKSKTFSWHVVQARINLIQNVLNLRTGITLEWNAYDFDSGRRLLTTRENTSMVAFTDPGTGIELDKNRLRTSYFIAPLMIDIKSRPRDTDKSVHIAAGGYIGARMGASYKQRLKGEFKDVLEDNFHTAKIKYGLRGEIGYGGLALFANYGLSDIFEEDEAGAYKVQPFTIGLNLGID